MTDHRAVTIGGLNVSNEAPFVLIAGPCQIESLQQASEVADALHGIATKLGIGLIYKSSFDKANRTSINGARGVGMAQGLDILSQVRARFGMPVLTDVHQPDQCAPVAEVADVLQIPAFLCRQTDLLLAAGQTGAAVNIKKGQFLAPWDMANVAAKVASTGNERIMLCERGTSFGYNTLVNDMRALPIMAGTGYPVIYDATHSVQQPGGLGSASGGQRVFAPILARAALAIGVAGVFIETHPDPDTAPSDGATMLPLACMEDLLSSLQQYDRLTKQSPPDVII
ncbi:3-deoxy-8-phosphooctulonate synthase [Komagataeibacter oboediens]|uniref:2-dehydro-3-deoxyphosphooctonate aldolase n=1 Tax=Komagataeibacter oboediens TaxID=65958 RepID=A0A318R6Z6_9PROT|nr:3-deoxy-8-phosphooctulonate synthase [Komagataeibacter oboediens]GBR30832.1 3-deoxy-8-phosphooctulonate synthase [Komagataeibacter oboediens DSM 11826]MBV0887946.1 3-deoxy-8-phosphooctulonate synthase [Komagataeibacter oboediens]MBV1824686.1 3-deoxy-8-phosphooctulonate synthase [Komagataeibacter oboediens]MCK9818707.1 3-deoxy-8-phosphooctulonate synthase [Komagataeibacter oboediens]PYD82013.1 3-deoxy-8-phosphooctulonate synthase [Komagataeibacter oboediens]